MVLINENNASGINPFLCFYFRWSNKRVPAYDLDGFKRRLPWLLLLNAGVWLCVSSLTWEVPDGLRITASVAMMILVVLRLRMLPVVFINISASTKYSVAPPSVWAEHLLHFIPLIYIPILVGRQPSLVWDASYTVALPVLLGLLFVCLGPFVNVLVFRLRKQLQR